MINITIEDNAITISGHSGYAPQGSDIVCAAISSILDVFIASMTSLSRDNIKTALWSGYGRIEHGQLSETGAILRKAFIIGLTGIADAYPDYVHMASLEPEARERGKKLG